MNVKAWKLIGNGGHTCAGVMTQEQVDLLIADGYTVKFYDNYSQGMLGATMSDGATFSAKAIRENDIKRKKLADQRRVEREQQEAYDKSERARLLPIADGLAVLLAKGLPASMPNNVDALPIINLIREEHKLDFECVRYENAEGLKRIRLSSMKDVC